MPAFSYGGQALIEGVLMRGRTALAVALRHPDGSIVWATERLDRGLRARRVLRLPFVRGLVLLYDTLVTGTRWLVRSATVAAAGELAAAEGGTASGAAGGAGGGITTLISALGAAPLLVSGCGALPPAEPASPPPSGGAAGHDPSDPDAVATTRPAASEAGLGRGFGVAIGITLIVTFAFAVGLFFLLPLFVASITVGRVDQGLGLQLTEGFVRVVIFMAYLMLIARAPDVRRVFQYHGAEHMSIHALEHGDPLDVDHARRYPTAHPRCGTEFLVVVLIVSILAFALVGKQSPLGMIASRVLLIPVIAAISYELLQFGAKRRRYALVRVFWSPGIWVQSITTRQPGDDMIEVAIVSLERALVADGQTVPEGSAEFAARPMDGSLPPEEAQFRPALDPEGRPLVDAESARAATTPETDRLPGEVTTVPRADGGEVLASSTSDREGEL